MGNEIKAAIKAVSSREDLLKILKNIEQSALRSTDVHSIYKKIRSLNLLPELKIAYLSNYTIDPLQAYVGVYSAFEGIITDAYMGGYDQYFQEVLNPDSDLVRYEADIIYLTLSIRKLEPDLYYDFSRFSTDEKRTKLSHIIAKFSDWINAALNQTKATLVISNVARPGFNSAGVADVHQQYGEVEFYLDLNLQLLQLLKREDRVHLLDLDRLSASFGMLNAQDPKMYYLAKMEWSEKFLSLLGKELIRYINATQNRTKKCLVLDLDNTLWGGVVGEDGVLGIQVGHGDARSEAFFDFQYKIKALKRRGILLGMCSKNNLSDVQEVFEKRPEMPLKFDDFAAYEINWDYKYTNIQKIAKSLNIGTDSIVFIDDNPAECSLVKQMLPEVNTIHLPTDPAVYPRLIDQLNDFEKIQILEDDIQKTKQYQQNKQREDSRQQISDLTAYLESLETEIRICEANESHIPRVHQLFTKTNQFNLTTIRYAQGDLERFIRDDDCHLHVISAKDRFGDLGIIALYLLKALQDSVHIDSFIMSCRAMGRGIETAVMNHLKQLYLRHYANLPLTAAYLPTKKNKPVEHFYEKQGFESVEQTSQSQKRFVMQAHTTKMVDCAWIRVVTPIGVK